MRDLLSIGTSRGCEMIGLGVGVSMSGFRLRSLADFKPSDITGLKLWLDASDLTTTYQASGGDRALADGDPVGVWADKSGSSLDAVNTSGINKPSLRLNVQNGKPVIRFDGVNDWLQTASALVQNSTNGAFSIFAVSKVANTSHTGHVLCQDSNVLPRCSQLLRISNGVPQSLVFTGPVTASASSISANVFYVLSSVANPASTTMSVYRNGVSGTAATIGSSIVGPNKLLTVGNFEPSGSQPLNGDIAELFIYDRALGSSDRQQVENYLRVKWGCY